MGIYEELKARGLIAQVTDEEEIRELLNNGKAVFYIGFDPTADSLHVGHFMALCLMKRLQMAGNKPIALIGGGTGMIGDPSGRSDLRQMMTTETICHNCDAFKKQMERFIEFGEGKAMMVNNGLADEAELRGHAAGGWLLLLREQYAAGRVLQAADGEGSFLSGIQLYDYAVL
jgi:tyrosyl-tRNA synthetase